MISEDIIFDDDNFEKKNKMKKVVQNTGLVIGVTAIVVGAVYCGNKVGFVDGYFNGYRDGYLDGCCW